MNLEEAFQMVDLGLDFVDALEDGVKERFQALNLSGLYAKQFDPDVRYFGLKVSVTSYSVDAKLFEDEMRVAEIKFAKLVSKAFEYFDIQLLGRAPFRMRLQYQGIRERFFFLFYFVAPNYEEEIESFKPIALSISKEIEELAKELEKEKHSKQ